MTPFSTEGRPHILIAGCGYVGQRLAARLRDRFEITALVRTNDKAAALERQGLKTVVIDLDRPRLGSSIPERLDQEAIVYLAPRPAPARATCDSTVSCTWPSCRRRALFT